MVNPITQGVVWPNLAKPVKTPSLAGQAINYRLYWYNLMFVWVVDKAFSNFTEKYHVN